MPRVTLLDVSRHAGVSRATASLVVRGSPRVAPTTAARVREAIVELGYVYDRAAANLRQSRSMTLGLVMTDLSNPFFAELTMAFEHDVHEQGYTLFIGYTRDDLDRQARTLSAMVERRVDGVCLLPALGTTEASLAPLDSQHVPTVLFTRHLGGGRPYVGADNVSAGRMLGEHLRSLGVRHLAFVGGQETSSRRERVEGLLAGAGDDVRIDLPPIYSPSSTVGGAQAVSQLLDAGILPDAVVAYNDVIAMGVNVALWERGLEPGRSIALAGFDDIRIAAGQVPGLTTVATRSEEVGRSCAELLLGYLGGEPPAPRTVLEEPELRIRASTGLWRPRMETS
ncbi:LacI family DNA-binding transcriptional regulator [Ruania albidiflava]|uniref:LacI family DNA-binding transcriptional regulator n=1 Tax=Ruania albidiflava TaxID=366586 RepID=UPI0003B67144|nr:LacI family DNA-binding transcriptional regulator [Ruania albidiflava]